MNFNLFQKACVAFFALMIVFWATLFSQDMRGGLYNDLYALFIGVIPFFGGLAAIRGYKEWGGSSTILGRAIRLLGIGLFLWSLGEIVWGYYNFVLGVDNPYPSLADLFFAPSVFFYTLGTVYLSSVMGARLGLKTVQGKVLSVIAAAAALVLAYFIFIVNARHGALFSDTSSVIKSILDIAYPLGDAVSLGVALVVTSLSFKYLQGLYRFDFLFILVGLALMFVADSMFSYMTTIGLEYNGGVGDLVFMTALFCLTCGLLGFNKIRQTKAILAD